MTISGNAARWGIMPALQSPNRLVDAVQLLELLFEPQSRPTTRWLRDQQKTRAIPYIKIGHLVRFDPERVREALDRRLTVHAVK